METTRPSLASSNQKLKASRSFAGLGGYLAIFAAGYAFNLTAGPISMLSSFYGNLSSFCGNLWAYVNGNYSSGHSLFLLCGAALVSPSIIGKFSLKSSRISGFSLLLISMFICWFAARDDVLMSIVGHVLLGSGIGLLNLSGVTQTTMESRGKSKKNTLKKETILEMMNGQIDAQICECAKTSQSDDKLIEEFGQVERGPHEELVQKVENPSQETNHDETDTTGQTEANPDMHQSVESTSVENITNNDDSTPGGEPSKKKKKKKKNKKVPDTNNGDATSSGDSSVSSTSADSITTNKDDVEEPIIEVTPSQDPRGKKMANNQFSALLNLES